MFLIIVEAYAPRYNLNVVIILQRAHQIPRQALRSVLPDIEELTDEDLRLLFMKIDADGSGEIDWDEFTGFLLQASEKNSRNPWHHFLVYTLSYLEVIYWVLHLVPDRDPVARASISI